MKQCPNCGQSFSWWERAVGEHREHMRTCKAAPDTQHHYEFSSNCRGCPAGCFTEDEMAEAEKKLVDKINSE